jgi:hypothetical protein
MPLHPFLGHLGSMRNTVMRSNTTVSTQTLVTSGTAYNNVTPVQLVASTAYDAHWLTFRCVSTAANSGARASTVVEFMLGGSGSEAAFIGPISIGGRPINIITLPCFVPAGSRISFRVRSARLSANFLYSCDYYGSPGMQDAGWPTKWIAYGVTDDASANANGTLVTPGNSNAWGSWTQIVASTTYAHELWVPVLDAGTGTALTAISYRWQYFIGSTGDAATAVTNTTIHEGHLTVGNTTESLGDNYIGNAATYGTVIGGMGLPGGMIYAPRASGAALSARGMCSSTADANMTAVSFLAAL